MSETYYKVLVDSPFPVIKGFVQGFMRGTGESFDYFFLKHAGDKRESLGDAFRDYLSLHCHCHICLPESVLDAFRTAISQSHAALGAKVESAQAITSALFHFSFHLYTATHAHCCKDVLKNLPDGVQIEHYTPVESVHSGMTRMHDSIYEFAPMASYSYEGGGVVTGDFAGVLDMYRRIKACPIGADVVMGDMRVRVDENEPVAV